MEQVFTMEGKASQVFKYLKLVSKYKGQTSVKDLKNNKKASK